MELSVIIVNWNSAAFLRACLASICGDLGSTQLEIIVVDNASFDESQKLIESEFPQVKYIQSVENLGFARANNLGFAHSRGRTLLFLNPDTEICANALSRMLCQLWSAPHLGAVGAHLLNTDLSTQLSCLQAFPTIVNQVVDSDYLKKKFPLWRLWGSRPLYSAEASDEVEMISGACLMVKRKVFEVVGLFSPEYFMYGDDVDLCYKIKCAGYALRYVSDAKVVHHGGQSSSLVKSDHFADVLIRESLWKFIRKTRSPLYAVAYRVVVALVAMGRVVVLAGLWPVKRKNIYGALAKWCAILRWSLKCWKPATASS